MEEGQRNFEHEASTEKVEELRVMKERIERSLQHPETHLKVVDDFSYTFEQLGLSSNDARKLCDHVLELLVQSRPLPEIEAEILNTFEQSKVKIGNEEISIVEVLHQKLADRATIITTQVSPHLSDVQGKTIDYGIGDGQVAQLLHDQLNLDIEGVDVRLYKAGHVTVPISLFNGGRVEAADGTYEAGLLTNVLHHEKDNEKIFDELDRIVQRKLVVLETVPEGSTEEEMNQDKDRTFMNDYLYNRLFHNADIPVPGTFETPQKWVDRFAQHGWTVASEENLGFDQSVIKDRHYLMVFEK